MPFLLEDMAPVVAALFAILISVAGYLITDAISALIGDVKILTFTLKLGSIFAKVGESIVDWFVGVTEGWWKNVGQWIHGHTYLLERIAYYTQVAVTHVGDQIAHLYNEVIPNAQAAAESYTRTVAKDTTGFLEDQISAARQAVEGALGAADRAIYTEIAHVDTTVENDIKSSVSAAVNTAEEYTRIVAHDTTVLAETLVRDAEAAASKALSTVNQQLGAAIAATAANAAAALAAGEGVLLSDIHAAEAAATGALSAASTALENAITAAAGTAAAALAAARSSLEAATKAVGVEAVAHLEDARTALETAIGTVAGDARAELEAAKAATEHAIGAAVAAGTRQLEGAVGGVYEDITGAAAAVGGDLTGLEGLLAGAITVPLAALAARVAHMEECAVTECAGPNNLEGLLEGILGVATIALIAPLLKEAIEHPYTAAPPFAALLSGTYTAGTDLFNSLLSL